MDELRSQSRADVSALQARMERFDNVSVAAPTMPQERFEEISERLNQIQSKMPERHPTDWWTRFKMWLFGTSDWYGESWGAGHEESRTWTPPHTTDKETSEAPTSIFQRTDPYGERQQQA